MSTTSEAPDQSASPRQHQTRLCDAEVDQLVAEYRAGASKAALARQFGISDTAVRAHLARRQVQTRPSRKLHGAQLSEAAKRYGAGESIPSLAASLGLSSFVVRSGLSAAGIRTEHR